MALIGYFSFDNVTSAAQLDLKMQALFPTGYTRSGTHSIVASTGRWTDSAWRVTTNSSPITLTVSAHATYIVGHWIRVNTFSGSDAIIRFRDGSTTQVDVAILTDGQIRFRLGSTFATIATSSVGTIIEDTWHYVEAKVLVHASAGTVEIKVDGVTVASATGVDTQQSGTAQVTNIQLEALGGSPSLDRQHIYICDGSGSAPYNTFLGFIRIVTDLPDTDGTATLWTPSTGSDNYAMIDEATPDDDTTYNLGAIVDDDDQFLFPAIAEPGVPLAVQDFVVARKDDVGPREIALTMLSGLGGAVLDVGSSQALAETYKFFVETRIQDPADGTPVDWDDSTNVDAAQSGYRIVT